MKFRVVALRLARCRSLAREALRVLAWPAILCAGLAGTSAALATASPMFWFNLVYLGVVLLILACERILPYERAWQANDGEMREDLAHTLFTKGVAQLGAYLATLAGAASAIALQPAASQAGPWPAQWPMALQVVLGLVVAELGLYVAHRAAHEWRPLWRFHALHHSVRRLWVINTGRFHIVDTLMKIACSQTPLLLLGAPLRVFLWVSAATAFIGLLTHCNIDVRTGFLDRIFSTPPLHRWHHPSACPRAIATTVKTWCCGIGCSAPTIIRATVVHRWISASAGGSMTDSCASCGSRSRRAARATSWSPPPRRNGRPRESARIRWLR